jgi:hypothetical protein
VITIEEFTKINEEVKTSINEVLDYVKKTRLDNYILYLGDGDYKKEYDTPNYKFSPYCIDNRIDILNDNSRISFLTNFLKTFYSFPNSQNVVDDNEYRIQMEMMVYTHLWESKHFLRKLYRLAHIGNDEEYNWKISVPEMGKHNFIRNDIRKTLEKKNRLLAEVIKNGFHTSLRNAFAHSDYFLDTVFQNPRIILTNYGGENWELEQISYDDWSRRFSYSVALSYHLLNINQEARISVSKEFNTNEFVIKHPKQNIAYENVKVYYHENGNSFAFSK